MPGFFPPESTTLCVQCNSGHDEHCEYNPPAASDCLERINQRNGCLVTRIYTNGKKLNKQRFLGPQGIKKQSCKYILAVRSVTLIFPLLTYFYIFSFSFT